MSALKELKELLNACSNFMEGDGDEARFKRAAKKAYEFYKKESAKEKPE